MNIPTSPAFSRSLTIEDLRKQVHSALANGLTGQMRITSQRGKTLTLFAVRGRVRQFYIRNHRAPDTNWEMLLNETGRGELEITTIPARGLMFKKIVLERLQRVEPQPSLTNQLKTMFDLAGHNTNPTLFHIQWDSAEGFALVAGKDIPLRRAVMMTVQGSSEGPMALEQVLKWNEARCKVAVHRGDIQSQAWFEVHLNILFEHYCSEILNKYGQLTGKVMIRSILWKIHTMAVKAGWNIETQNNEIADSTIFPTARDAGDAYKKIIAGIVSHVEPVIGHALTQNILSQSFGASKEGYRTITDVFGLLGEAAS